MIDGKAVAAEVARAGRRRRRASSSAERGGDVPGLATVLVGDDPASQIYVAQQAQASEEVGMRSIHHELGAGDPEDELLALVARARTTTTTSTGSSSSCRCPSRSTRTRSIAAIDPAKDVDGLTAGKRRPARPGAPGARPVHAARA